MQNEVSRRSLLGGALAVAGVGLLPATEAQASPAPSAPAPAAGGPFTLPPLPYKYDALEPHIDTMTMQLHHDKHHAAYVKNLNDAIGKSPELASRSVDDLVKSLDTLPEALRMVVRNNGGGHLNHTMFWTLMKPGGGGAPKGAIADVIKGKFGSFEAFQAAFNDVGAKRFGSGWVWLAKDKKGEIVLASTANQDSPLLVGAYPILGNDVWEHAYYLKYQNRRPDYLKAWWNVVDWDEVNKRLAAAG